MVHKPTITKAVGADASMTHSLSSAVPIDQITSMIATAVKKNFSRAAISAN